MGVMGFLCLPWCRGAWTGHDSLNLCCDEQLASCWEGQDAGLAGSGPELCLLPFPGNKPEAGTVSLSAGSPLALPTALSPGRVALAPKSARPSSGCFALDFGFF